MAAMAAQEALVVRGLTAAAVVAVATAVTAVTLVELEAVVAVATSEKAETALKTIAVVAVATEMEVPEIQMVLGTKDISAAEAAAVMTVAATAALA